MSTNIALLERPIYVVDTNVIVDYVDIIPNGNPKPPEEPTVDLTGAHLVIPTAVVRELSSFKKENSERGKAARMALDRLRKLVEGDLKTINGAYNLEASATVTGRNQVISILPVHKSFKKSLPFSPSEDDMDGQIILATLTVMALCDGMRISGTSIIDNSARGIGFARPKNVTLLTNDNGLAIRARERGIRTQRFGYQKPVPYTGRRDLVVPKELFSEFYGLGKVSRKKFEEIMPQEPRLIANEFVVMKLANTGEYPPGFNPAEDPYFEHIGRYDMEEDAIVPLRYVNRFPIWPGNAGQAIYAEALSDPKIAAVICTGPAGSGKTYMAMVYSYLACRRNDYAGITVVPCENRTDIGALPGDLEDKMEPDVAPMKDALINYYLKECSRQKKSAKKPKKKNDAETTEEEQPTTEQENRKKGLSDLKWAEARAKETWDNWVTSVPVSTAHGRTFAYQIALFDEFQDQSPAQADTLLKRLGTDGKIVLTGDVEQIHNPYLDRINNGLVYAGQLLLDNPMVAQVSFTEDEVVRHPLVREIARRQKKTGQ